MSKWTCNKKNCEFAPCETEMNFRIAPKLCPAMIGHCSEWELDEMVTDCNPLPDWCKPDKIVWIDPTNEPLSRGYMEILFIEGKSLILETGRIDFQQEIIKKTRLRKWRPAEAIGKVVIVDEVYYVISGSDEGMAWIGNTFIRLDDLLKKSKQPDGSPCGVLEHLEDGEWVP